MSETVTEHQRQDYEAVPEAVRLLTSGGPLNPPPHTVCREWEQR